MPIFDKPYPPSNGSGRFFVHRGFWTQFDPFLRLGNENFPFGQNDRFTPYRRLRIAGVYFGFSHLEVTFDVDAVDLPSLDGIRDFIRGGWQKPVIVDFYKDGWVEEYFAAPAQALARIEQIMRYRGLPMLRRTLVRPRPIDQLIGDLRLALQAWCADKSRHAFSEGGFFERSVVFEQDASGLRFGHIGKISSARRFFGERWSEQVIGLGLSQFADNADYDKGVASAYPAALASGQPRHDQVMASVVRGSALEWTAYDRLILPFRDALVTLVRLRPPSETALGFLAS